MIHPLKKIISLERNLTPKDGYFFGMAAKYSDANESFKGLVLKLDGRAERDPTLQRYLEQVRHADPVSLWHLGCDVRGFSKQPNPGLMLRDAAEVACFHNPENLPPESLTWLQTHDLKCVVLPNASHWPTIDQPKRLADEVMKVLHLRG